MSAIGARIHVMGNSGSGKTTLAARLAKALDADLVELDALNWEPGWAALNESDPEELERRSRAATEGERWVTDGSYTGLCQRAFWPRLDTIVWLDLPLRVCVWRLLRRTYSALEHERMCDALVAPRVCRLARITCAALRAQAFASQINSRTAGSSATRRARAVP